MLHRSRGIVRRICAATLVTGVVVASSMLPAAGGAVPATSAARPAPRVLVSVAANDALEVTEGGQGDVYSLVLASRPTHDVTVDIESLGGEVRATPNTLRFDSATWSTGQLVRVTAIDDPTAEPSPHGDVLLHATTSQDPTYDAAATEDVRVSVTDDDAAGVLLLGDPYGTFVVEGGPGSPIDVQLRSRPAAPVEVFVETDGVRTDVARLVISPETWDSPHAITVSAVEDGLLEGRHSGVVRVRAGSIDANYGSLPPVALSVTIDDVASAASLLPSRAGRLFTMSTPAAGAGVVVDVPPLMQVDEVDPSGTIRTIGIRLASAPTSNVTVQAVNDGQVGFTTVPTLTFTPFNWYLTQTIDIVAIADGVVEPLSHQGVVQLNVAAGSDPNFVTLTIPPVTFDVHDADSAAATLDCLPGPGWTLDPLGRLRLGEGAASASCLVQLGATASSQIRIEASTGLGSRVILDPPAIVIPPGATGPFPIRITAVDDNVARGSLSDTLSFTVVTSDPVFSTRTIDPVPVDLAEDDVAGVQVDPGTPIAIGEGGPGAPVNVRLTSQPVSNVTVAVVVGVQATASQQYLVFTPTNWNIPQSLVVSAIDDYLDEPDPMAGQVIFAVTSTDPAYDGFGLQQLPMAISDNDVAGVVVEATGSGTTLAEGGASDTVNLRLGALPADDVTVTLTSDGQLRSTPATLTFTPANWNVPQLVTLEAVQDLSVEGPHTGTVSVSTTSTDIAYATGAASTPPITSSITDDDLAGAKVTETDGGTAVTEAGGSDTYTIVLTARPLAEVVIVPTNAGQLTAAPAEITFTPSNWDTAQTVTVTAVQDTVDEADPHTTELTHAPRTTAPGWGTIAMPTVAVKVADDDTAAIDVVETDGSTRTSEGAATGDKITVRLATRPQSTVTIAVKGNPQMKLDPAPLVLTADNWKDGLSYEVRAKDDADVEGDHQGSITLSVATTDAAYKAAATKTISVSIGDNDEDRGLSGGTTDDEATIEPRGDGEAEEGTGTKGGGKATPSTGTREGSGRTTEGTVRTTEGTNRTDAEEPLVDIPVTAGDGAAGDDDPEPLEDLNGEIVAASEEAGSRAKKRSGPTLVATARSFAKDHWKVMAPIAGLGMVMSAAGAFFMNGDPIKAAQRGASAKGVADVARRAARSGANSSDGHHRLRRLRRRKKDDEDDGDDDVGARKS
ncbi:MAG: hypothetical protein JWM86_579 [Thermoleophilia bacterium]|nr:hypothetical protein [Thermoleophilia bacterium]